MNYNSPVRAEGGLTVTDLLLLAHLGNLINVSFLLRTTETAKQAPELKTDIWLDPLPPAPGLLLEYAARMESSQLRRKDTTKGPPLRILSLGESTQIGSQVPLPFLDRANHVYPDGGGVRGYSMLILLQELMYRTYVECEGKAPRRDQIPKPCDHFDLIAGTGTGGLIAIMLGRMRLDLETCKDVYVRMTRRVFETDKTIAGIPYRSTLFKASKLEDAIRDCVREHTIFEDEGNDGTANGGREAPMTPNTPGSITDQNGMPRRSMSTSTAGAFSPVTTRGLVGSMRWGNPNAYLYDSREYRTKTQVAMFRMF